MRSLLTRVAPGQQFRCLVLRVPRGELSFGDDVTAFSYQILIDRSVIVSGGAVCHGRPSFLMINKDR
ncbi:hypothetical protein ACIBJF_16670 [Streptomyces sp. NPDC050743]|uniref:hypothetical protein n=1 Tax=Streptomyces sp. NPDC050743 TaxID=3365634 RepID=UPI0037B1643B